MTILLYANDASTTLLSGITSIATSATLSAGTGSLFPSPATGQSYYMTFVDAATQQVKEIVLVTARSGDVVTIVRGQQGTSARSWAAGDLAAQLVTAGDSAQMVQPDQLQSMMFTAAVGGGTGNSITATVQSQLTVLPDQFELIVKASAANTGATTLTVTLGTSAQPAYPIHKGAGGDLSAGDIPSAGYPIQLIYSSALGAFIMSNPAAGSASNINGGLANELLYQIAPSTTRFVAPPTVAGSVLAFVGGVIQWITAAVTSFNGRSGAVTPQTGDYTAAQVGAVPVSAFQAPNKQNGNPMYDILPSGNIYQSGNRTNNGTSTNVTFPFAFPHECTSVVVSCNDQSSAIRVVRISTASFQYQCGGTDISWQATGW